MNQYEMIKYVLENTEYHVEEHDELSHVIACVNFKDMKIGDSLDKLYVHRVVDKEQAKDRKGKDPIIWRNLKKEMIQELISVAEAKYA